MSAGHRHAWFAGSRLLLLGAAEIGGSFFHFDRSLRPLLLLPGIGNGRSGRPDVHAGADTASHRRVASRSQDCYGCCSSWVLARWTR